MAQALSFDGVDDQVNHGDIAAIDGATALTVMCWLYSPTAVPTSDNPFIEKSSSFLMYRTSAGALAIGQFGSWEARSTTSDFAVGAWAHFAITYNGAVGAGSRVALYKNGSALTVAADAAPSSLVDTGATDLIVGLMSAASYISHVRVWTAALSAGEVAAEVGMDHAVLLTNLILDAPYSTDGTDVSGSGNTGTITGAAVVAGPDVSGEVSAAGGSYAITGTDVEFDLATATTGGLIFDYVLAQESSEAIWPSRMSQLVDWAVPIYLNGERVVLYTKSGSNQIWVMGADDTGTLTSSIDLPWMSRLDDTKVTKWLGLVAAYKSTVPVDVYVRYANNPGEFNTSDFTLRGTLPANPTITEGGRIGFGGSSRWVQVRFQAETLDGGGFELFPPIHLIPVDTQRSPN